LKNNCLRFTSEICGRQDFFGKAPYNKLDLTCEHYIDDRPAFEQIQIRAYQIWLNAENTENDTAEKFWLQAETELINRKRNKS